MTDRNSVTNAMIRGEKVSYCVPHAGRYSLYVWDDPGLRKCQTFYGSRQDCDAVAKDYEQAGVKYLGEIR